MCICNLYTINNFHFWYTSGILPCKLPIQHFIFLHPKIFFQTKVSLKNSFQTQSQSRGVIKKSRSTSQFKTKMSHWLRKFWMLMWLSCLCINILKKSTFSHLDRHWWHYTIFTVDLKIAVNTWDLTYTYQPILMSIHHTILLCQHTTDCAEVCLWSSCNKNSGE